MLGAWSAAHPVTQRASVAACVTSVGLGALLPLDVPVAVGIALCGAVLAAAALVDLHEHKLPNRLLAVALAAAVVGVAAAGEPALVGRAVIGLLLGGGLMLLVRLSRGVGMGDVKMAAVVGASTAPVSTVAAPLAIALAALGGGRLRVAGEPHAVATRPFALARVGRSAGRWCRRVAVMSGQPSKVRSRVRTQWLALGAAFVVLAGVLVAWALSNAAERVQVVQVATELKAGDVIELDDLAVTGVAYEAELQGLVPEQSLEALVGRVAAIDIEPGTLLVRGMWEDAPVVHEGEAIVGALLAGGRFPAGLARGDVAIAAPIDPADETAPVTVRVIATSVDPDGNLVVQLAVPIASAVSVGQLAATDQLLLVGEPTVAAP